MIGISALAVIDKKGKSILSRNYRREVPGNFLDLLNQKLLEFDMDNSPPLIVLEDMAFFFVRHENVTLVAVTRDDSNALMAFTFLESFEALLVECFGVLDADAVRENTILIYELMDEIMDNGYPQMTDFQLLKKYVTSQANVLSTSKRKQREKERELAQAVSSATPWRSGTYKYSKNEAYLDVIEMINMTLTPSGQVLKAEVEGVLHMNSRLSGTPELVLGLNDKKFLEINRPNSQKKSIDIQDLKFHQCVRLGRFENDRTISFVPPDGEFDLINYKMDCPFKGLFTAEVHYEKQTDTKLHFVVKAKTHYKLKVVANFAEFWIPVPPEAQNIKTKATMGSAKYLPENDVIAWKIQSLPGKKDLSVDIKLDIPSLSSKTAAFKNQPIQVMFEIPYYTLSGLNVKYLHIKESSNYQALSWVRYIAKNGDFTIRTNQTVVK